MKTSIDQLHIYITILASLFVCSEIQAALNENSDHIYLKNGRSISFTIVIVQPWGVINEKRETASYKVMDSLFTTDSSMAYKINQVCKGLEIRQTTDGFLLSFINYISPKRLPKAQKSFVPHSISLLYRYDIFSRYDFQYYARLFGSKYLIHRFQSSIGFHQDEPLFSSLNFAFGVGYEYNVGNIRFSFVTSFGLFGGVPKKGGQPEMSSVIFVSPVISYRVVQLYKIFLTAGLDAFLYHDRADLPEKPMIFFLDIGINLK
jgi:hypothetical protein